MRNPLPNENLIIVFPSSQVFLGQTCTVQIYNLGFIHCQVINSTALSMNTPMNGLQTYIISGFTNQNIFNKKAIFDKIRAVVGNPYISATTTENSTTHINPRLSYGAINLHSIIYSNNNMFSMNTITYDLTI